MKRYSAFLGALLLMLFAANNLSAQQTDNTVREIIDSRNYVIEVKQVTPMAGRTVVLSPGYTLRVNDDSVTAQLPYYGRVFMSGYDSAGSLRFTAMIRDYSERAGRKGAIILDMSAEQMGENFDFQLTFYPNGNVDILTRSDRRQQISYRGVLRAE